MGSRRSLTLGLLCILLLVAPITGGSAAPTVSIAEGVQVDPDTVLLRVNLQSDGTAAWRVEYRLRLDDENSTEAFESLRADIEANQSEYEDRFRNRMQPTVTDAEETTGREMSLQNVTVRVTNTTIPQQYGVIEYSFVWTNFAEIDDDRLVAGDAISGLFLDDETTLIIGWPSGYELVAVSPEPHETRDRAVVWEGRLDFADGEPRVVVTESPGPPTVGTSTDETPTNGTGDGDQAGGLPWGVIAVGIVIGLVVVGGAGWLYSTRDGGVSVDGPGDGGDGAPPEDLLSNQERVLRVLEDHGGRIKQQQVASELGWTDAKTSQIVGDLRDDGEIEVFRLGRENVISLPEEDSI